MSVASLPRLVMENGAVHQRRSEREVRVDEEGVSRGRAVHGFVVSTFRFQPTDRPRASSLSARRPPEIRFSFAVLRLFTGCKTLNSREDDKT